MPGRDLIVIGSSMGGIEALTRLVRALPAELGAAVLIVQHVSQDSPALLGEILDAHGPLPAVTAEDGMPFERGRIYVAPPDRHLLAGSNGIRVVFGPRENRHRPAIDPLFRTAAVNHGSRVIGVVLTGLLGDGAAGLQAIATCGGVAVVQDPADADHAEMPRRALERVPAARVARLAELPQILAALAREEVVATPPVPEALRIEAQLTERAMQADDWHQVPGNPTRFTCPECRGAIQAIEEGGATRYRCRVGHAYSADTLLEEKDAALETSLWVALQTLQERVAMLDAMARDDRRRGWMRSADSYAARADEARVHAERLRELVHRLAVAA